MPSGPEMGRCGDAIGLANDDRAPGDPARDDPRDRFDTEPHRAGALRSGADHEARFVDEAHDRQVEGVTQVDEASHLEGSLGLHGAGVETWIVGDDADRVSGETREARDQPTPVAGGEFEEARTIEDGLHDRAHLVDLAPRPGNDFE